MHGLLSISVYLTDAKRGADPPLVGYANDGQSTCPLVGSTNVQGQYSNTPLAPERFLHLEQSRRLRDHPACLIEALKLVIEDW